MPLHKKLVVYVRGWQYKRHQGFALDFYVVFCVAELGGFTAWWSWKGLEWRAAEATEGKGIIDGTEIKFAAFSPTEAPSATYLTILDWIKENPFS